MPSPNDDLDLARRVLQAESHAIHGVIARLGPEFTLAVDLITRCGEQNGTLLVTGLGKSGLIGAKIAATFSSLGIPSHRSTPPRPLTAT